MCVFNARHPSLKNQKLFVSDSKEANNLRTSSKKNKVLCVPYIVSHFLQKLDTIKGTGSKTCFLFFSILFIPVKTDGLIPIRPVTHNQ